MRGTPRGTRLVRGWELQSCEEPCCRCGRRLSPLSRGIPTSRTSRKERLDGKLRRDRIVSKRITPPCTRRSGVCLGSGVDRVAEFAMIGWFLLQKDVTAVDATEPTIVFRLLALRLLARRRGRDLRCRRVGVVGSRLDCVAIPCPAAMACGWRESPWGCPISAWGFPP